METAGKLIIVGTPIGNRGDFSTRGAESLEAADVLLCEDTRVSRRLTDPLQIEKPMIPFHEHNEKSQATVWADAIASGKVVALLSDAGMPGISDPGFRLVRECRRRDLLVEVIPGPTAFVSALAISGLPTDSFYFRGFLPPKKSARQKFFQEFRSFGSTLCLYESNHRIEKFIREACTELGPDRWVSVAKEITKIYETVITLRLGEMKKRLETSSALFRKGEFVVMIAPEGYEL
ncbi:MAG: 16S rRNA (cytidine(1402)-2'-O)-methyltransferase [Opitutales bacterium]|nr:16S rRNA (cytidine(1402)-2'-O)-methyltransferase [Opitutales bacterium]MCH8541128.1 16S rRNA (cytidine(1402)-2'-O)-methyltransferase [Opitutales bacterium]